VLYNDPAMGIFRHNDAGYAEAEENMRIFDLGFR
jgi:urocanate hydratase